MGIDRFIPTGTVTQVLASLVVLCAVICFLSGDKRYRLIGAALIVSLIGARLATEFDILIYALVAMSIASFLCIKSRLKPGIWITIIYGFRAIVISAYSFLEASGMDITTAVMWNLNEPLLIAQLMIAAGGGMYGGTTAYNRAYSSSHRGDYSSSVYAAPQYAKIGRGYNGDARHVVD